MFKPGAVSDLDSSVTICPFCYFWDVPFLGGRVFFPDSHKFLINRELSA